MEKIIEDFIKRIEDAIGIGAVARSPQPLIKYDHLLDGQRVRTVRG